MHMKNKAFSAVRWTASSAVAVGTLRMVQVMVVARLLEPSQFGLMAVAAAVLAITGLVADFGMNRVIIHRQVLSPAALTSLFWFNLAIAIAIAALIFILSPLMAHAYGDDRLAGVLAWSSLALPFAALGSQFRSLATRDMQFPALARNEITAAGAGFAVTVASATGGMGVYSLVGGTLATAATSTTLAWISLSSGRKPGWRMNVNEVRKELRMGGYFAGESIAGAIRREADVFIAGLAVGASGVGVYAVPRELGLRIANTVINPIVTRVGLPVMSKLQSDPAALRRAYLASLRMSSALNFPIYVLLGLFSKEVVSVLYGPQWDAAVFYLQIVAAWGLLRSVGNPIGSLIAAAGRARLALAWNSGLLVLTLPALWCGAFAGGLPGLAWTVLAIQAITFLAAWRLLVLPLCGAQFFEYMSQIVPPLALSTISGFSALLAVSWIEIPVVRLASGCTILTLFYLVLSYRFNAPWVGAMIAVIRPDRSKSFCRR
jgi:O-antigen/teichoic acid export membrane protein